MELRLAALAALELANPAEKVAAVRRIVTAMQDGQARLDTDHAIDCPRPLPGRPLRPTLVLPGTLPRRSPFTASGRAALLHAVAHIEFNAIKTVYNEDHLSIGI